MNDLLSYISRDARPAILIAVIGPLVYWLLRRKPADDSGKIETGNITAGGNVNVAAGDIININIATVKELEKRLERLEQEQGKTLPKEKMESCFVPGVRKLEAGRKLLQFGEEAQAKSHFEEAIKFFICAADALPCYETFFNLSEAYKDYCDYDNAYENYQKAIQHDPTQPGGYNGLGTVYFRTSDYSKAEEYYRQALTKAEKLSNKWEKLGWQAIALGNLGLIYTVTGQMKQALEYCQQSLNISRKIGYKLGEAQDLGNLGVCRTLGFVARKVRNMAHFFDHLRQIVCLFNENERENGYVYHFTQ